MDGSGCPAAGERSGQTEFACCSMMAIRLRRWLMFGCLVKGLGRFSWEGGYEMFVGWVFGGVVAMIRGEGRWSDFELRPALLQVAC